MSDQCTNIRVRQMSPSDIPGVVELERQVFPGNVEVDRGRANSTSFCISRGPTRGDRRSREDRGLRQFVNHRLGRLCGVRQMVLDYGLRALQHTQSTRQDTIRRGFVCGPISAPPWRGLSPLWHSQANRKGPWVEALAHGRTNSRLCAGRARNVTTRICGRSGSRQIRHSVFSWRMA